MTSFEVSRTLVKSPPEVWAELEKAERLAELLGDDAIKITRAKVETSLEWEGSAGRGTIEIEQSGWGTKVRLTADIDDPEPEAAAVPLAAVEEVVAAAIESVVEIEPPQEEMAIEEPEVAVAVVDQPEPIASQPAVKPSVWKRLKSLFEPPVHEPPPTEVTESPVVETLAVEEEIAVTEPAAVEAVEEPAAEADEAEAEAVTEPAPEPIDYEQRLTAVLDHLGSAHKRPFAQG